MHVLHHNASRYFKPNPYIAKKLGRIIFYAAFTLVKIL